MASDVTTSVTAVVSVVDKATPAIEQITKSLEGVAQAQQQIAATVPTSVAEMLKDVPGNIWNLPVRGADVVPDLAGATADQVEKIGSIWDRLKDRIGSVGAAIKAKLGAAFESVVAVARRVGTVVGNVLGTVFSGLGGFAAGYGIAG